MGSPEKMKARDSSPALGLAVNVPSHQAPFACRARTPSRGPP